MKRLIFRAISVTIFIFLALYGFKKLSGLKFFDAFDPISQALGEFEFTDYVFSTLQKDPDLDTRIVLVNIGQADRRFIAQQIATISQSKPKVIGIDSYFNCEGGFYNPVACPALADTLGNLLLSNAIQEAGNVVLVSRFLQTDSLIAADSLKLGTSIDIYDSIETSDAIFNEHAYNGFANLVTSATYQEDVKICRSFIPRWVVNGKEELAFAVKMVQLYDSARVRRFLNRNHEEEIINFKGNIDITDIKVKNLRDKANSTSKFNSLCYVVDMKDFEEGNFEPEIFKDAIVIMGYLGDYLGDSAWEDKFFTPLNIKTAGRANPDMFGVVIHANIVSMILNEDYVENLGNFWKYAMAILFCLINVVIFTKIDDAFPNWYDASTVFVQLIEITAIALISLVIFDKYRIKIDITLILATTVLLGPCFDIWKSIEYSLLPRFTKRRVEV